MSDTLRERARGLARSLGCEDEPAAAAVLNVLELTRREALPDRLEIAKTLAAHWRNNWETMADDPKEMYLRAADKVRALIPSDRQST